MNSLSKRESWANTPEEKIVFFDGWTPTNIIEIANMRSCGKFSHVHEVAIHPEMRQILDAIADKKVGISDSTRILSAYWVNRARTVLEAYTRYNHPLYGQINLLSDKGKKALNNLRTGYVLSEEECKVIANKDLLDLDLFIDVTFDIADFAPQEYKFLSLVSGCPYQCVYCAENSGSTIYSMPYPIYLKVLNCYARRDEKDAMHIGPHNDSEAPMYYDPVIHADLGDVSYSASKWQSKISILTKGVPLGGRMDLALSKRYYSRNKPSISKVNISLLEGDDIERNLELAFNVQKIAKLYHSEHRLSAKVFAAPDNLIKYADRIKLIKGEEGTLFWAGLEPIGRATNIPEAKIRLSKDEINNVLTRAGFGPGEIETNMQDTFDHNRYLTADGHLQMDAFGQIYMKYESNNNLTKDILYDIYGIKQKVR